MMKNKLILASGSPRRKTLLAELGVEFEVHPADIEEKVETSSSPSDNALRLSREKALKVAETHPGYWILASDTVVALDGELYGKPTDAAQARAYLQSLSGRQHTVHTGICLLHSSKGYREEEVSTTAVLFDQLSDETISAYVRTGEPFGKAGAYSIQGLASRFVKRIEGSFTNVVGLDVCLVRRLLRDANLYSQDIFAVPLEKEGP